MKLRTRIDHSIISRGSTLAAVLILIPLALAGFLVVFHRLEINNRETVRQIKRSQARHLAESALLELQARIQSANAVDAFTREIADGKTYHIETAAEDGGSILITATGMAQLQHSNGELHYIISARLNPQSGRLELRDSRYQYQLDPAE